MKDVPQHITVDLPQGAMGEKVGARMSVRLPIVMTDESGREIRGFFTKDEFINTNNLLYSRSGSLPNAEQFAPILEAVKELPQDVYNSFYQYLFSHDFNMHETGTYTEEKAAAKIKQIMLDDPSGYRLMRSYMTQVLHLSQETVDELAPPQDPRDLRNKAGTPFIEFFAALIGRAGVIAGLTRTHVKVQKQTVNTNINRRNNAMSDYADLVESPGLIARSVSMTVVQDGVATQGTYMLNADGITCASLNVGNPALRQGGKVPTAVVIEAEAKRDLSRMQVLDFLCGNVDRHANNFMLKVDTSDPDKIRIVGAVGIDNDASFGVVPYKGSPKTRLMSPVEDIKVIDAIQAAAILELTPEKLDKKLRLATLSAEEVQAAHDRLAALQKRIRDGKVQIIRSMKQWDAVDLAKLETRTKDNSFMNLFSLVGSTVRRFFQREKMSGPREDVFPKVKATAVNIQQDYSLQTYGERFREMQKRITDYALPRMSSPTQEPYQKALNDIILELDRLQKGLTAQAAELEKQAREKGGEGVLPQRMEQAMFRQLSDQDRNRLSLRLKQLEELAGAYANAEHTKPRTKADQHFQEVLLNNAKNVAAFAAETRHQIHTISMDAEMALASKLARDISGQKNEYKPFVAAGPAPYSHAELMAQLETVDSKWKGSSPAFKEMLEDLKAVEGSERFPTENARKVGFQKLNDSVNAYLAYKKHEADSGKKLSPYAQERIKYALKIREFAAARLDASKKSLADISNAGDHILGFLNRCKALQREFEAAKTPEAQQDSTEHIAAFREEYRKGCETLLTIAKSHTDDRPTQLAVYNNLVNGPIAGFQVLYAGVKKDLPDLPELFTGEEQIDLANNIRTIDTCCKAFPQTAAANVTKRPVPKAGR